GVSVADDEVAQIIRRPCFHIKCQAPRTAITWRKTAVRPILEDEDGYPVISNFVNQLGARRLIQIGEPPAFERKRSVGQLGKVKGERNFSLEPGLHRVPVG